MFGLRWPLLLPFLLPWRAWGKYSVGAKIDGNLMPFESRVSLSPRHGRRELIYVEQTFG